MLSIHYDNDVRVCDGAIDILERKGMDNIIRFSTIDINSESLDYQFSVGTGFNIYDITVLNENKAYIVGWEESIVTIINPKTGIIKQTT